MEEVKTFKWIAKVFLEGESGAKSESDVQESSFLMIRHIKRISFLFLSYDFTCEMYLLIN